MRRRGPASPPSLVPSLRAFPRLCSLPLSRRDASRESDVSQRMLPSGRTLAEGLGAAMGGPEEGHAGTRRQIGPRGSGGGRRPR